MCQQFFLILSSSFMYQASVCLGAVPVSSVSQDLLQAPPSSYQVSRHFQIFSAERHHSQTGSWWSFGVEAVVLQCWQSANTKNDRQLGINISNYKHWLRVWGKHRLIDKQNPKKKTSQQSKTFQVPIFWPPLFHQNVSRAFSGLELVLVQSRFNFQTSYFSIVWEPRHCITMYVNYMAAFHKHWPDLETRVSDFTLLRENTQKQRCQQHHSNRVQCSDITAILVWCNRVHDIKTWTLHLALSLWPMSFFGRYSLSETTSWCCCFITSVATLVYEKKKMPDLSLLVSVTLPPVSDVSISRPASLNQSLFFGLEVFWSQNLIYLCVQMCASAYEEGLTNWMQDKCPMLVTPLSPPPL